MMVDIQSPLFSGGSRLYHRLGSRGGGSEIRGNGRGSFLQDPPLIFAKPGVANQIVTLLFLYLVPYFP